MAKQPTCQERIDKEWRDRRNDLEKLWAREMSGKEFDDDLGNLHEYGLSIDYVAPETFRDQFEGYWRWQFSTGGPGDEIRFFASHPKAKCYRIEYWFLDWHDGAHIDITKTELAQSLWSWLQDAELPQSLMDDALRD